VTLIPEKHTDADKVKSSAGYFKFMIKKILDDCTCPELCLECRRKLHRYINALCCLPDTILTEGL